MVLPALILFSIGIESIIYKAYIQILKHKNNILFLF